MSPELNEKVARALALEYYRGQYKVRTDDPKWVELNWGSRVEAAIAARIGETEAQHMAESFWSYWMEDAMELLEDKEK